ncbi:MAG: hypothetical protein SFW64_02880 [Alphaproteobacteria bacterium]|nr:hypothetical protein [Alphaproteobacteria bacterium]
MPRIKLQCLLSWVVMATVAVPAPAQPVGQLPPLPAVALPSRVASPPPPVAAATPVVVAPATTPAPAPVEATIVARSYSYGGSNLSILFLPSQISRMQEAIRHFEDSGLDAAPPVPVVLQTTAAPVEEKIEDPLEYPVFYLASIAYDKPGEWSLWVSGYKITSHKNETDVTVVNVTPESATFSWTPSFAKALLRRQQEDFFASADLLKHRLAGIQRANINEKSGAVTFTLKQNQSFAAGYFRIFEGYVDTPELVALPPLMPAEAMPEAMADAPPSPSSPLPGADAAR